MAGVTRADWPSLATLSRRDTAIRLALVVLPVVAYAGLSACGFVNYDDTGYVTANPRVLRGLTVDNLGWAFTHTAMGNFHPVTLLSHMLDCELFGPSALAHHLVSLALHVLNGVLLFELLLRTTKAPYRSAFVAALFALHPTHVESVAWISERKDVLSALFWLLTAHVYVGWVRDRRPARYAMLLAVSALGFLSKPMLVTLPFVLLLLDVWPLARTDRWRLRIVEKIPLLCLAVALAVTTYLVQKRAGAMSTFDALPLSQRVANAFVSYVRYLGKTAWPTDLAVFYPLRDGWPAWQVAGSLALLVAITALAVATYRLRPYLLIGWLLYLGLLVPVIGIVQVGTQSMADRYLYLPSIGLFVMAAWGIADIAPRLRWREAVLGVASAGVLGSLLLVTRAQVRHWRSSFTLFDHALAVTRDNWEAHNHLGLAHEEVGESDAAIAQYQEALAIKPTAGSVHGNLGVALANRGRMRPAITHLQRALALKGDQAEAHYNLGNAWLKAGNVEAAVRECGKAVALSPEDAAAHLNLGIALAAAGAPDRAATEFRRALELDPSSSKAENNLGVVLANQGQLAEALEHFRAAARLDPKSKSAADNVAAAGGALRP